MESPRLVIWDWNGTLLDDTKLCYDIANIMRQERGMRPLDGLAEYKTVFRFPIVDYYRAMGYTFETESYEDISVEFIQRYSEMVPDCRLHADVLPTLAALQKKNVPMVLLSATGYEKLLEQTAMFGIQPYFREILGMHNDLAYGKASLAKDFMERNHFAPDDVLFVGDTDHDHAVASSVGCHCLLLTNGHQGRTTLEKCRVPVADRVSDVLAYFE